MKKRGIADPNASVPAVVQLLVDVGGSDTVYGDVYLRRARELLDSVLPVAEYNASKRTEQDIDEAIKQSKAATMAQDWQKVETLAAKVDALRSSAQEKAARAALGATVYDAVGVSIDPFSPGFESLKGHDRDLAEVRDTLVEKLKALAGADASSAKFYESRRAFFAGFALLSKRGATSAGSAAAATTGSAELEQLAAQAAQQGDMAQLRRYAQELLARRAKEVASGAAKPDTPAAVGRATYECPVDLAVPFSADVVERARALGLAVARTEPVPQSVALLDYVFARVWQPNLSGDETEREGALRTEAIVDEMGFPKEVSEPVKVLVGQFLRNPFVSSGGARYLPPFGTEEVLIEDFPEEQEPPAAGELLTALGLERRRSLARLEIDDALLERGAAILEQQLRLDPLEFRLVCIPHDLYMRFGRDRSWGRQQQWTHFDGYQVLKNGTLRALVGGDVRHGGLSDLVSIAITDQRECVVARFAVVRRARQVARWH
jgi:hypothetical protein